MLSNVIEAELAEDDNGLPVSDEDGDLSEGGLPSEDEVSDEEEPCCFWSRSLP